MHRKNAPMMTMFACLRDLIVHYSDVDLCLQPISKAAELFVDALPYDTRYRGAVMVPGDASEAVLDGLDKAGITYLLNHVPKAPSAAIGTLVALVICMATPFACVFGGGLRQEIPRAPVIYAASATVT